MHPIKYLRYGGDPWALVLEYASFLLFLSTIAIAVVYVR